MNQIIPPTWRTHLGDHAFKLGKWATYCSSKKNCYAISKFQRFLILRQLCLINLNLEERKVSYGEANVLHHIGSDFLEQYNLFS